MNYSAKLLESFRVGKIGVNVNCSCEGRVTIVRCVQPVYTDIHQLLCSCSPSRSLFLTFNIDHISVESFIYIGYPLSACAI